jgi:IS30 family transposase
MSDPRNVAHKKKVTQEKHHQEAKAGSQAARKSRKKETKSRDGGANQAAATTSPATPADTKEKLQPGDLEKSLVVLAKLKDFEFHSRANIEALAQLSLTIEEELKQREFAEAIGAIYSAQEAFHSKIAAFIETYKTKCEDLQKPPV